MTPSAPCFPGWVDDPAAITWLRGTRRCTRTLPADSRQNDALHTTVEGKLLALRYLNGSTVIRIERSGESFSVSEQPVALERRVQMKSGEIKARSSPPRMRRLADAVAIQIAEIFSTDIDFHRDLRSGDRFTVVYETFNDQGEQLRTGRVLAVEFVNSGKAYQAVYFQHADAGRLLHAGWQEHTQGVPALSAGILADHFRFHPCPFPSRAGRVARA